MIHRLKPVAVAVLVLFVSAIGAAPVGANGGPFVIKYPNGDPAAKGVLARLDPSLKPTRVTQLRVVEENLTIAFTQDRFVIPAEADANSAQSPLVEVTAAYTIENPTAEDIAIDFGFPILRGIYIHPYSMMPAPDVTVTLTPNRLNRDATQAAIPSTSMVHSAASLGRLQHTVISNSAIYGMIRQRARDVIDTRIEGHPSLKRRVDAVRQAASSDERDAARLSLLTHLREQMKWTDSEAALMVEYASLNFGALTHVWPRDRAMPYWSPNRDKELLELANGNLGLLAAIGEQKATQFFACLASRFDPAAASDYEDIFKAWGGDVRERSVDLVSGAVRPREIEVDRKKLDLPGIRLTGLHDPTVYARVDYFDENAKIGEAEKASCKAILKNLPVVFTFAPMNLLHYQAKFPAKSTQVLTVKYKQYAFTDTRAPRSHQLAYVVHPASMWDDFGPINLRVLAPEGVRLRSSSSCHKIGTEQREVMVFRNGKNEKSSATYSVYETRLASKKGELLVAIDAAGWDRFARLDPTTMARHEQQAEKAPQPR